MQYMILVIHTAHSGQVNPTPQPTSPSSGTDDNTIEIIGAMQCCKRNDASTETVECMNIIQRSLTGSETEMDCTSWSKYKSSSTFISGCSGWTLSVGGLSSMYKHCICVIVIVCKDGKYRNHLLITILIYIVENSCMLSSSNGNSRPNS